MSKGQTGSSWEMKSLYSFVDIRGSRELQNSIWDTKGLAVFHGEKIDQECFFEAVAFKLYPEG